MQIVKWVLEFEVNSNKHQAKKNGKYKQILNFIIEIRK